MHKWILCVCFNKYLDQAENEQPTQPSAWLYAMNLIEIQSWKPSAKDLRDTLLKKAMGRIKFHVMNFHFASQVRRSQTWL